jgi:hypothetical protein
MPSSVVKQDSYDLRRDAILPVLNWLTIPDWFQFDISNRAWFIKKMDQIDIRERVLGLIFNSNALLVDEAKANCYVIYKGQLLRMPIANEARTK